MRDLAFLHAALSDETRLRLLNLMKHGEICVCSLQEVLGINQPKISRHLAYLKRAGVVESRRYGKWKYYRLKKLNGDLDRILSETLICVGRETQAINDNQRLKRVGC